VAAVLAAALLSSGCLGVGTTPAPEESPTDSEGSAVGDLRAETLAAMANVSAYSAEQNVTIVRENGTEQRDTVDVEYAINRTSRSLAAHRLRTGAGTNGSVDRYVLEETLYQRDERFVAEHGSEWIRQDISTGFARQWHLYDQLWRYQFLVDNATLTRAGTETVDGTETRVLEADVDTAELDRALREALDLPPGRTTGTDVNASVQATFWVDRETDRPIKVRRTVEQSDTAGAQSGPEERVITTHLTYENVSVSLPENASDATVVSAE